MNRIRRLGLLVLLSLWVPGACYAEAVMQWVEAEGLAFINSQSDQEAARRRALGDALISAALAGGANLQGFTALHNSRVTSDLAIVRPQGRVLRHDVLWSRIDNGHWRVRINALVGPQQRAACSGNRRLTVNVRPPQVKVPPNVPAWAVPLATQVAKDVVDVMKHHASVDVDSVSPKRKSGSNTLLNYTELTSGPSRAIPGNHELEILVELRERGKRIDLFLVLQLTDAAGRRTEQQFTRIARAADSGLSAFVTGASRQRAEATLKGGLVRDVQEYLDMLVCQPAEARLAHGDRGLTVGLGTQHGLSRSTLAFVDDPNDSFSLLEVTSVGSRAASLRPLDPTRSPDSFAGLRVYFLEAGQ